MKCTNCSGGYIATPEWPWPPSVLCRVCNGLGVKVEQLPYQEPDSPEYQERMKRDEETVEMFQQRRLNLTDEEKAQLGIKVPPAPWRKPIWFP